MKNTIGQILPHTQKPRNELERYNSAHQSVVMDTTMNQLTLHRSNGALQGFEFVSFEEVSDDFEYADVVYALQLRQRMYGDEWTFTALHSPRWDNVLLSGDKSLTRDEYTEQAVAAFCYFSVILK